MFRVCTLIPYVQAAIPIYGVVIALRDNVYIQVMSYW